MEVLPQRREVLLGEGSGLHNTNGGGLDGNTAILDVTPLNVTSEEEEKMRNMVYFEHQTGIKVFTNKRLIYNKDKSFHAFY